MQFILAIAALATAALAAPVQSSTAASCEFSAFESFNLLHGHDVNTGKIKLGSLITTTPIAIGGSGCSPAWAVGGKIDDNTPVKGAGGLSALFGY